MGRWIFIPVLGALVMGCAPQDFQQMETGSNSAQKIVGDPDKSLTEASLSCSLSSVAYQLDMKMLGFEVMNQNQTSFGFNLLKGVFSGAGFDANVSVQKATMTFHMDLYDSTHSSELLGAATEEVTANKNEMGGGLNFQFIKLNTTNYYQTKLSDLSLQALNKTLAGLKTQSSTSLPVWSSWVVKVASADQVFIPVGTQSGLRVGDELNIYKTQLLWKNQPCSSELLFAQKEDVDPIAVGKVMQLDTQSGLLKVSFLKNGTLEVGDVVEVKKLAVVSGVTQPRQLLRPLKLRQADPAVIKFGADSQEIDLMMYAKEQIKSLVKTYGFYLQ